MTAEEVKRWSLALSLECELRWHPDNPWLLKTKDCLDKGEFLTAKKRYRTWQFVQEMKEAWTKRFAANG